MQTYSFILADTTPCSSSVDLRPVNYPVPYGSGFLAGDISTSSLSPFSASLIPDTYEFESKLRNITSEWFVNISGSSFIVISGSTISSSLSTVTFHPLDVFNNPMCNTTVSLTPATKNVVFNSGSYNNVFVGEDTLNYSTNATGSLVVTLVAMPYKVFVQGNIKKPEFKIYPSGSTCNANQIIVTNINVSKIITPQNQANYGYTAQASDLRYIPVGGAIFSASVAATASLSYTSSVAVNSISASYSQTASFALNISPADSASYAITASYSPIQLPDITDIPSPLSQITDAGNGLAFIYDNVNGQYTPESNNYQFLVYAYKTIGAGRVYSSTPVDYSGVDNGGNDNFYLTASWNVVPNASGYRVVVTNDPEGNSAQPPFAYFDTTFTSFNIGSTVEGVGYDSISSQYYTIWSGGGFFPPTTPVASPSIGISCSVNVIGSVSFDYTSSIAPNSNNSLTITAPHYGTYNIAGNNSNVLFNDYTSGQPLVSIGNDLQNSGNEPTTNWAGQLVIVGKSVLTGSNTGLGLVGGFHFVDANNPSSDNRAFIIRSKTPGIVAGVDTGSVTIFESRYCPGVPDADTTFCNFLGVNQTGNVVIGNGGQLLDRWGLYYNAKVTILGSPYRNYNAFQVVPLGYTSSVASFIVDAYGNVTASIITASFVGTLTGVASTASYVASASYATSASYALTASYITSSNIHGTVSSASYAYTAVTASYITASNIIGKVSNALTADTASYVTASNIHGTVASASYALNSVSSSYFSGSTISASNVFINGTLNVISQSSFLSGSIMCVFGSPIATMPNALHFSGDGGIISQGSTNYTFVVNGAGSSTPGLVEIGNGNILLDTSGSAFFSSSITASNLTSYFGPLCILSNGMDGVGEGYDINIKSAIGSGNGGNINLSAGSGTLLGGNININAGLGIAGYGNGNLLLNPNYAGSGEPGGNVGIKQASPQYTLDVNGNIGTSGAPLSLVTDQTTMTFTTQETILTLTGNYAYNDLSNTSGDLTLNGINGNNVGIKKTNPQTTLDVNGDISDSITNNYFIAGDGATSSYFAFAGSNVGIATNSPAYTLDVFGDINFASVGNLYRGGVIYVPAKSISASYAATASYIPGTSLTQSVLLNNTQSQYLVFSQNTSSLTTAIYNYSFWSGSNIQGGHINNVFLSGTSSWNNVATVPIGSNTTDLTMSVVLTGSLVNLYAAASSSINWRFSSKAVYF